jgi:undecaprenyl phosphate-alpha-L-ara4N flippase subunit ArnE
MNLLTGFLLFVSQLMMVAGQLLIKHAMNFTRLPQKPWGKILGFFSLGLGALSFCFFLWLGFLQKFDLSHIFPFEGLSPVILVGGASLFLGERIDWRCWAGMGLISFGIVLVGIS